MEVINIILWVFTGLLGVIMWFLKTTVSDLKEQQKETRQELNSIKDTTHKKSDFSEFKLELFSRLDKLEQGLQKALDR